MPLASPKQKPTNFRLQKYLAQCGLGSRRACEGLIAAGRVTVNERTITEQGVCIDPATDTVRVDGSPVRREQYLYILFNKPRDVLCTCRDPDDRRTFKAYLPDLPARLFPVGRLDRNSEGLLILTNDGEFSQRMMHPSYEVPKVYLAEISGVITEGTLKKLRNGIELDDGPVKPDKVELIQRGADRSLVRVTLHEGRNRIVRRMFDEIGQPVVKLSRIAIGPVRLGELKSGAVRDLTREELGALLDLVKL